MHLKESVRKIIQTDNKFSIFIFTIYTFIKHIFSLIFRGSFEPAKFFIFKQKEIIYIVNSKVAQTSITNTCGTKIKEAYRGIKDPNLGIKKYGLNSHEKKMFTFSFVRNPFERLYSCHKSKLIADRSKYKREILDFDYYLLGIFRKDPGFEKFAKTVCKIPDRISDRHFKSQSFLLYKNRMKKPDYVGKYENLSNDFEPIRVKYGLENLPHLNSSEQGQKENWMDFYTPELVELVAKRYKTDLELWYPNAKKEILDYLKK